MQKWNGPKIWESQIGLKIVHFPKKVLHFGVMYCNSHNGKILKKTYDYEFRQK